MSQPAPQPIESADDFFSRTGPMRTSFDEVRRFPRFYFRTCAEAVIYPLFARDAPKPAQCFVLTCDLSRGGISLLHNQQLFPGQRIDVILNGQPARQTEVVWCRRLADHRYAAGCRFKKPAA